MKLIKLTVVCGLLGCCSTAIAMPSWYAYNQNCGTGFYLGAGLGYGQADFGSKIKDAYNAYPIHSNDEDDIAGRAYLGYQITPIIGVEAGYSLYEDNTYKGQSANGLTTSKSRLGTETIDLLATLGTPLYFHGFGLTVKGGAAYVMSDYHHSGNGSDASFAPADRSNDRFAAAAGASIIYKLPDNMAADISYLHIFAPAHVDSPETDLVTLGLSYRFA
ncbi:MAG TPA: outer membrane beta-barrel protein [Gammaproteobacteria bacterium]|nr:outer membrane beta-barrel protein [Gammaproteobacteria bacterium]